MSNFKRPAIVSLAAIAGAQLSAIVFSCAPVKHLVRAYNGQQRASTIPSKESHSAKLPIHSMDVITGKTMFGLRVSLKLVLLHQQLLLSLLLELKLYRYRLELWHRRHT